MARKVVNRSKYALLTCDMGQLIPIGIWETLPNETVRHNTRMLIRMSPMSAPIMHPITARVHHFFCPSRKLWEQDVGGTPGDNWQDFITGGDDGRNAAVPPQMSPAREKNDLLDYLGVPPKSGLTHSELPVRCVNWVYNEWFRDQDLVDPRALDDITVPLVSWEKDYFTSSRPWLQKGPNISIPIGDIAPIRGIGKTNTNFTDSNEAVYEGYNPDNPVIYPYSENIGTDTPNQSVMIRGTGPSGSPDIFADLAASTGANVNDVRLAFALQKYQENRARWGSRYVEYLAASFRARPQDSRLQRPELLGGGRTQLNVSEVLQTAPDDSGDPRFGVADMYGHGIAAMKSNAYQRNIPEHGYIVSFLSVRPKSMYMNGMDRHWIKQKKEDYFQPELKYIGQQEVFNNEVYADGIEGSGVFGYQDRYSEYRHSRSSVHAEFRDILKYWHLGREFEDTPVLNQSFIDCVPSKRIFNEQTQHSLWIMAQHRMKVLSPIGKNAAPRII